jgi:preprotein translocase SecE subunit
MAAEQTVDEQQADALTETKGRATPGRRSSRKAKGKTEPEGNSLTRPLFATVDYFSNVRSELNKVAWPSREDTRRLTILCINVTIASALFLGILSLLLTEFIQLGLARGNSWMLLGVIVLMVAGAFGAMRRGYL